jgi:hypothetical protein
MNDEANTFLHALLEGNHSIRALRAEFGDDQPGIDLSALTAADLDELQGSKITPPEPIRRYLDSGDTLDDFTIDQMERAMEAAAAIAEPFYITSMRSGGGKSGQPLAVNYFYLDKDA